MDVDVDGEIANILQPLSTDGLDRQKVSEAGILRPLRVVHVIDSLGRSGGAEQQLVANLRRFADRRLSHSVLCLYRATSGREDELPEGVEVSYLKAGGKRSRNRIIVFSFVWLRLWRMRPDLVHCTLPDASLAARVAGRLLGVPVVETLVNISHEEVRMIDQRAVTKWKLKIHSIVDRWFMQSVAKFHALSQEVARSWSHTVGIAPKRITVIPRGVQVEGSRDRVASRHTLLRSLSIDDGSFVILNVGRQVAQKGQIYAVRAMVQVVAELPHAVFVSAGSYGPMSNELRSEAARCGVASYVHWLGVRDDVVELMAAADVFVFPSLYEGLGVSLLQAMASELPCVATNRPPMTEIVTNEVSGLLVPPHDPTAIAEAIVRLGRDEALRFALGRSAKARVVRDFSLSTIALRVEALYAEALGLT